VVSVTLLHVQKEVHHAQSHHPGLMIPVVPLQPNLAVHPEAVDSEAVLVEVASEAVLVEVASEAVAVLEEDHAAVVLAAVEAALVADADRYITVEIWELKIIISDIIDL